MIKVVDRMIMMIHRITKMMMMKVMIKFDDDDDGDEVLPVSPSQC